MFVQAPPVMEQPRLDSGTNNLIKEEGGPDLKDVLREMRPKNTVFLETCHEEVGGRPGSGPGSVVSRKSLPHCGPWFLYP